MIRRIVIVCLLLGAAGCTTSEPKDRPSQESPATKQTGSASVEAAQKPPVWPEAPQEASQEPLPATAIQARACDVAIDGKPSEPNEPNQADMAGKVDATVPVQQRKATVAEPNEMTQARPESTESESSAPTESKPAPPTEVKVVRSEPIQSKPHEPEQLEPSVLTSFYNAYGKILKEFVQPDGLVNYTPLRRKRLKLKHLLAIPDALDPNVYETWSQNQKLAFWINTYNLKMLDVITRNYPIESSMWLRLTWPPSDIRHIKGIWSDYRFIVMDEEFTLGDVERRVFRRTFGDPRVYFALTYACKSSPRLRREPYQGRDLDRQLDEQVKAFLSDDQVFKIDVLECVVHLSALFKPSWRGKEFVGRYGTDKKFKSFDPQTRAVLNFLTRYVSAEDAHFLEVENYTIKYVNFDWRLNDTAKGY